MTLGSFDPSKNGNIDVFITKLDPAGASLVYSTFMGGDWNEYPCGLAVVGSGTPGVGCRGVRTVFPSDTAGAEPSVPLNPPWPQPMKRKGTMSIGAVARP